MHKILFFHYLKFITFFELQFLILLSVWNSKRQKFPFLWPWIFLDLIDNIHIFWVLHYNHIKDYIYHFCFNIGPNKMCNYSRPHQHLPLSPDLFPQITKLRSYSSFDRHGHFHLTQNVQFHIKIHFQKNEF